MSDGKEIISLDKKKKHFNCKNCEKVPLLQVINKYEYKLYCGCNNKKENIVNIKYLKDNYINEYDFIEEEDVFNCLEHYYQFKDYCQTCKKYLCEKCYCPHPKQNLDNKNIEETIKYLENLFWPKDKTDNANIDENENDKILKEVIKIIIEDYHRGKNLNLNTCIVNFYTFFFRNEFPTINSPCDLKNLEENVFNKIIKIDIYQYYFDLKLLERSFPELKELNLRNNNIDNLKFLTKGNFPNLELLYLDINKIDDKVFEYMKDFKCKNLKEFSLKQNYITDYRIFDEVQKNFKYLKKLDISSNKFKNIDYFKSDIKINLDSIEQLILSNGVFDEESIKNISKINVINLQKIDLSGNSIKSLEFINEINWPKINQIILNDNDISDIKPLKKFKNNKNDLLIIIENNLIENDEEINKIINNTKINIKIKLSGELKKVNDIDINTPTNVF